MSKLEKSIMELKFGTVRIDILNPEHRCPCVLLLDTSESMKGEPIEDLNAGLRNFIENIDNDEIASKIVELEVFEFNSKFNWIDDCKSNIPKLLANGQTYMGTAILNALDCIQKYKKELKKAGTQYYRPWLVMITDGRPEGEDGEIIKNAATTIKEIEEKKGVIFLILSVKSAKDSDISFLKELFGSEVIKTINSKDKKPIPRIYDLRTFDLTTIFDWLSDSIGRSVSRPESSGSSSSPTEIFIQEGIRR